MYFYYKYLYKRLSRYNYLFFYINPLLSVTNYIVTLKKNEEESSMLSNLRKKNNALNPELALAKYCKEILLFTTIYIIFHLYTIVKII